MGAFVPEEGHGLNAIGGYVQADRGIGITESFLREPHITRAVFDEENFQEFALVSDDIHDCLSVAENKDRTVEPRGRCGGAGTQPDVEPCLLLISRGNRTAR
jgi:hypothetical protein